MNKFPPIIKNPAFYPGQMGVEGADVPEGLRIAPTAVAYYVDTNHSLANDSNDGTDPDYPLATIQAAVNKVSNNGDVIYVAPGSYAESVVTPDYATGPNYVSIVGLGNTRYACQWQSAAADEIALDLRAVGWSVENFRFMGQASAACVEIRHTDSGANDIAIRTHIKDCYFDGLTTGLTGIASHGAYDVWVTGCTFSLWHNAGGTASGMKVGTTPLAIPYRNVVKDCMFYDNDNHCEWPSNGSMFVNNMFQAVGYAYSATLILQTSIVANPGDDNIVWGNTFAGDYSIAGGYRPGAADEWLGNWASDTAEAEVGDNGITIARPT